MNKDPILTGNEAWISRLKSGEQVTFGGKGNSMVPKIKSGQKCTYEPIMSPDQVNKGDMVFCTVGRWTFTHLVTAKKLEKKTWMFQISNNHGHVNGWIPIHKIYGKVIEVHP